MSLSKFIKLPDVKDKFKEEFVKPDFREKKPILAPVKTSNPQMMGTAFDYALRFYANFLNSDAISNRWVAEKSVEMLDELKDDDTVVIGRNLKLGKFRDIAEVPARFIEDCKTLKYRFHTEAKKSVKVAKKNLNRYLKTGKIDDRLIASAINLAELDPLVRKGYLPPLGGLKPDINDMEDLRRLLSIINPNTFKTDRTCVLNPSFGPEANELMGADCDIVLDDALIDIKTYRDLKLRRDFFNQLLGYYTLYRIGGIRGMSPENKITKLGIYFSRHGYLHTYQVKDIINESTYPTFIEWFKKRALESGLH